MTTPIVGNRVKGPKFLADELDFDAIVVGSGSTGGWAAKELTEKGLKTLMLDRGRMIEHGVDYTYEGTPAYEIPYRGQWPPGKKEKHFQQWPANPWTSNYWNDDARGYRDAAANRSCST